MRRGLVAALFVWTTIAGIMSAGVASCGDDVGIASVDDAGRGREVDEPTAYAPEAGSPDDASSTDGPAPLVNTCTDAGGVPETWIADPRLCLAVYATDVLNPRQLAFAPNGDLFAIAGGQVTVLFDDNKDLLSGTSERSVFATAPSPATPFSHSVVFSPDHAFVYASTATTIYRWAYTTGDRIAARAAEVVVHGMPPDGHDTRTLLFDGAGDLYVNVGSGGDFDFDAAAIALRSMVRRFAIPTTIDGGVDYSAGEVFASGLRNEVALTIDSRGRLWGVENGVDPLGDDNPAEELNRLDSPTHFFGHPYCYSEFKMEGGLGPGTQWSMPASDNPENDLWCRNPLNVQRPAGSMQAHWAPLGIIEYTGNSLPWRGDLLITAHGSFDRAVPVGRLVARAHLVGDEVSIVTPIVGHAVDGGLEEGSWDVRPVDVRMGAEGAVYLSDTEGNRILRLGYRP